MLRNDTISDTHDTLRCKRCNTGKKEDDDDDYDVGAVECK